MNNILDTQFPKKYQIIANPEEAGLRIDKFLAGRLPELSRSRVKSLIEAGYLSSNGQIIKDCSASVKPAIEYSLIVPAPEASHMQATSIALDIVYEDEFLLVINKQAGLTVHPGAGNYQDTLANALLFHCGDNLSGIGGVQRPGIVHRLDKDTTGLLVVAKTDKAHQELSRQIASRELARIYTALVWGVPIPSAGTIKANMARSTRDRTKMSIVRSGGKEAITHYKVQEVFAEELISLVECKLETGRTHQIRVHFSHKGHSLVGDQTYGNNSRKTARVTPELAAAIANFNRQALHSTAIAFTHPETEEYLSFEAPLPGDMQELLKLLK